MKADGKPAAAKLPDRGDRDGSMANKDIALEIRNRSHRSFKNLRAATRYLQGKAHDGFGTVKVRDASVSCVRRIKREARMTLAEIEQWANDSMRG